MKRRILVPLALLFAGACGATPFEHVVLDVRGEGLGSTASGLVAEPGSALANPALLGLLPRAGAQFLTQDWYGSGIRSLSAGWAQPAGFGGVGISWHRYGVSDLWTEDQVSLSTALRFAWRERPLALGLRLRGLAVSAPGYEGGDALDGPRGGALDLAVHARPLRLVGMNLISSALWRSEMEYLENGERWPAAPRETRVGLDYLWRRDLALILEVRARPGRAAQALFGAEVRFFDAFHVRAGSGGDFATAGFGLRADRWMLDFAFQSRGRLGNNVALSFSPLLPGKEGLP